MPAKNQKIVLRKPRTDAQRNRERILETAKGAFTRSGANASLDDIAKEAGVGAGTLYRHFPTRDALIEAVYRTEVEKVASAEKRFSESLPPIEALVRGLHRNEADHRPCTKLGRWRAIEAV
jgi:AcrR family transcriptional regulator